MSEYKEKTVNPKDPRVLAEKWTKEVAASKKWLQRFHSAGAIIEREYLSQQSAASPDDRGTARYNIFWANVQVQLAATYTKMPVPEVDRTHFDQNDDVARVAALILERIFSLELKNLDESPFDVYKLAIQDRFVPGMGVVWPRYTFSESKEQVSAVMDGKRILAKAYEKVIITDEAVPLDYVRWDDFFYSPCRVWTERRWEARRAYMPKPKAKERFGDMVAGQLSYKNVVSSKNQDDPYRQSPEPCAEVYEIWDRDMLCVSWYSPGCPVVLDYKDDPLGLQGFFPAKKPLMATHVTNAFIPRPDYVMVQDQYRELNLIASRTMLLTEALKLVGVYDKSSGDIKRMLSQANMNELIPVDNWAMFAEKGGIKGVVDWMPLEAVAKTLEYMSKRKAALLQEVYEILGLSDIMRGQSVASETATAQQLKAQYGSARMQHLQNDIAEFITEATRTRAEIICLHWQPQTIIKRSQIMATPDAQYAQKAVALLKSNTQMALRLTVHADTIAAPDWNQEKQLRVDFLQAVSQFITMSAPLLEQEPGAGPFLIQIMQWAAAGFKGGKQIEGVLDQALMALQKAPAKPPDGAKEAEAMRGEAEAMKKEVATGQQAFAKETALREQLSQEKLKGIVDRAMSQTREMITKHECSLQLMLASEEAGEEGKEAEGKAVDDKQAMLDVMGKLHQELLGNIGKLVESLGAATVGRTIDITLPDGQVARAEVSPKKGNGTVQPKE